MRYRVYGYPALPGTKIRLGRLRNLRLIWAAGFTAGRRGSSIDARRTPGRDSHSMGRSFPRQQWSNYNYDPKACGSDPSRSRDAMGLLFPRNPDDPYTVL